MPGILFPIISEMRTQMGIAEPVPERVTD